MSSTPAVPQSPPRKKQELLRECDLKVIEEVGSSDFSMAPVKCKAEVNNLNHGYSQLAMLYANPMTFLVKGGIYIYIHTYIYCIYIYTLR